MAYPQTGNIDSLEKTLSHSQDDTSRINTLNAIGKYYLFQQPDKALTHASRALELSLTKKYKKGIIAACNTIGIVYRLPVSLQKLSAYTPAVSVCEMDKSRQ